MAPTARNTGGKRDAGPRRDRSRIGFTTLGLGATIGSAYYASRFPLGTCVGWLCGIVTLKIISPLLGSMLVLSVGAALWIVGQVRLSDADALDRQERRDLAAGTLSADTDLPAGLPHGVSFSPHSGEPTTLTWTLRF